MVDNQAQSVSSAYGLTFFPFSIFVDADGVILGRLSGAIPMDDILNIAGQVFE